MDGFGGGGNALLSNAAGRLQAEESEFRNPDMRVVMVMRIFMVTAVAMAGLVYSRYDHDADFLGISIDIASINLLRH